MKYFKTLVLCGFSFFFFTSCIPIQYMDAQSHLEDSKSLASYIETSSSTNLLNDKNRHVDKWINYFSEGAGRNSMKHNLQRSNRYLNLMKNIFREYELPENLVYIAMVESGFKSSISSSQNAHGYWQFIAPTGKKYGLTIDTGIDERQDFVLSTHAAAQYLKFLFDLFDDWNLAIAAYNAGEYRVSEALRTSPNKNYWYLVDHKKLPSETSNFVPKIIAMKEIALSPWRYNFKNLNYMSPLNFQSIDIYRSFSLNDLSNKLKVPHEEILKLNPKYKQDIVRVPNGDKASIRIPTNIFTAK